MGKRTLKSGSGGSLADGEEPQKLHVENEIRGILRSKGLRATRPRIEVLAVLHERAVPMTHEQIMGRLPVETTDKASVWRLLAALSELDILRRMDLGDRIWRYELIDSCRRVEVDHSHLLCEDCGDVSCLPSLEVRTREGTIPYALQGAKFRIRVMGRCAKCVAA